MRYARRVPGTIIALFAGTAISLLLKLPMETIATRFGGIPSGLPHLLLPQFRPELLQGLLQPALTVAMLGAIESLMSATVADRMSGDKHDPNTIAGIIHSITIAVVLLVGAPLVQYVPLSVPAGILMMVAYNMDEWVDIPALLRLTRGDFAVWAVTLEEFSRSVASFKTHADSLWRP